MNIYKIVITEQYNIINFIYRPHLTAIILVLEVYITKMKNNLPPESEKQKSLVKDIWTLITGPIL